MTMAKSTQSKKPAPTSGEKCQGIGKIEFSWSEGGVPACEFNKMAITGKGELLMVSFLTTPRDCKLIGSMVANGAAASKVQINGWTVWLKAEDKGKNRLPGSMTASYEGYEIHRCKLGFNLEHVLLITKNPAFLMINSPEALWRVLTGERYTTPVLECWLPYLRDTMIKLGYLEDAYAHGCRCGMLSMSRTQLDLLVVDGLTKGLITI